MWILLTLLGVLVLLAVYDLLQRRHAILRNFPIIGHFRYLFEAVGPELRQYIVTNNNEERPFNRDERRWIYASSKKQNSYFGFGTDQDLELSPNYLIIKHKVFPLAAKIMDEAGFRPDYPLPCAKVLGDHRKRAKAFRPGSVVNISGMSFGSLSGPAVEAMNRGAAIAGCLHNTGEGGVATAHRHGADLIWQIGTGYFGCREPKTGGFSRERFLATVAANPVRAVEIKLSQGAKPGLGGVLPAAKVSAEIAEARGIPKGKDCLSPNNHSAFRDVDSLLDFVESLGEETGLPIGIKSAVGHLDYWRDLARLMSTTERGVDFITIDGGEGGTGAGPLVFTDHVAMPFKIGMSQVYRVFAEAGLQEKVVFNGSGKLGFPQKALLAFALGCDTVNVGREAMISVGCIQAQRCHTGHCPTGVATQNPWLMRGLDPHSKAHRAANYLVALRKEITQLSQACGVPHPALVTGGDLELLDDRFGTASVEDHFHYEKGWGVPSLRDQEEICKIMDCDPAAVLSC